MFLECIKSGIPDKFQVGNYYIFEDGKLFSNDDEIFLTAPVEYNLRDLENVPLIWENDIEFKEIKQQSKEACKREYSYRRNVNHFDIDYMSDTELEGYYWFGEYGSNDSIDDFGDH